jgi:hypothetical protein
MSYSAIEVDLLNGCVIARGAEALPASGKGLLVILSQDHRGQEKNGGSGWSSALDEIRRRQLARGHVPRSAAAVAEQLAHERGSWE